MPHENNNHSSGQLPGVRLGSKVIGPGRPCYVVAEIGINHNGDIDLAKKLINVALGGYSLLPLFEQLGENFRGILQIGHEDNDGVAARLQERMHGGADLSEVTRVADNLNVRVGGGDFAKDGEGGITGRVVQVGSA